jgi:hypothetical protein
MKVYILFRFSVQTFCAHKLLILHPLGEKLPSRVKLPVLFTHLTRILTCSSESLNLNLIE